MYMYICTYALLLRKEEKTSHLRVMPTWRPGTKTIFISVMVTLIVPSFHAVHWIREVIIISSKILTCNAQKY